jgi:lipoprotein-anchoring transpeptidase ErfK/SrfK
MAAKWRSRKYNNAPMPWSVFFYRGYAIHGTTDIRRLGQVASHGCVRLHPDNARTFYRLVEAYGKKATLVSVVR